MIDNSAVDEAMAVLDGLPAAVEQREQLGRELRKTDFDATAQRLAALLASDPMEYERQRKREAKRLKIRAAALDRATSDNRGADSKPLAGSALEFPEPDPWSEPVNGAQLLDELTAAFRRHLVLPDGAAEAISLWTIFSHCLDSFRFSPRLAFVSPTKQCGKTTALGMLVELVSRALPASNVTSATVFRVIESARPTLIIDEADTFLPDNEGLRGVLNSGHSRSAAFILRCVGDDFEPRKFSTWAAIAIACINKLPDTLTDRSIVIQMRRKTAAEQRLTFDDDAREALAQFRRKIVRWLNDNGEALADAKPAMPAGFNNRRADNWRPLLAIADAAGGDWAGLARDAAARLSDSADREDDGDKKIALLADIRRLFEERRCDRLFSKTICEALACMEGRPWAEWKGGKPISPNAIARLLKPFGVAPSGSVRIGAETGKGYKLDDLRQTFDRYLPAPAAENVTDAGSVTDDVTFRALQPSRTFPYGEKECDGVTDQTPQAMEIPISGAARQQWGEAAGDFEQVEEGAL